MYSKCYQYAIDWNDVMFNNEIDFMPNTSWPVEKCTHGWEYNKTEVKSSIVIDVSRKVLKVVIFNKLDFV
jgi:hypothetical protein